MIVVDSTVWIDFFADRNNPQTEWLEHSLTQQKLALTDLILCEVLQGIRSDSEFRLVQRELAKFTVYSTGGEALAVAAAENYRALRKRGLTVRGTVDCLIATFCIEFGHELLHKDRDFDVFTQHLGLHVVLPRRTMFQ